MSLAAEEKAEIVELIRNELPRIIHYPSQRQDFDRELELRERIVRVEEELKRQRELMMEGFKRMDERFEAVDKRFEAVDKRFESFDKRFSLLQWTILAGFSLMTLFIGLLSYFSKTNFLQQ